MADPNNTKPSEPIEDFKVFDEELTEAEGYSDEIGAFDPDNVGEATA